MLAHDRGDLGVANMLTEAKADPDPREAEFAGQVVEFTDTRGDINVVKVVDGQLNLYKRRDGELELQIEGMCGVRHIARTQYVHEAKGEVRLEILEYYKEWNDKTSGLKSTFQFGEAAVPAAGPDREAVLVTLGHLAIAAGAELQIL